MKRHFPGLSEQRVSRPARWDAGSLAAGRSEERAGTAVMWFDLKPPTLELDLTPNRRESPLEDGRGPGTQGASSASRRDRQRLLGGKPDHRIAANSADTSSEEERGAAAPTNWGRKLVSKTGELRFPRARISPCRGPWPAGGRCPRPSPSPGTRAAADPLDPRYQSRYAPPASLSTKNHRGCLRSAHPPNAAAIRQRSSHRRRRPAANTKHPPLPAPADECVLVTPTVSGPGSGSAAPRCAERQHFDVGTAQVSPNLPTGRRTVRRRPARHPPAGSPPGTSRHRRQYCPKVGALREGARLSFVRRRSSTSASDEVSMPTMPTRISGYEPRCAGSRGRRVQGDCWPRRPGPARRPVLPADKPPRQPACQLGRDRRRTASSAPRRSRPSPPHTLLIRRMPPEPGPSGIGDAPAPRLAVAR